MQTSVALNESANQLSRSCNIKKNWITDILGPELMEGNGYETRESSLLYVFVLFFGLDRAQNIIVVYSVLRK